MVEENQKRKDWISVNLIKTERQNHTSSCWIADDGNRTKISMIIVKKITILEKPGREIHWNMTDSLLQAIPSHAANNTEQNKRSVF